LHYASQLLDADSENPTANFCLGLFHQTHGEELLARDAYLRCLEKGDHMAAMNNLAWLEQDMGNFEEAIRLSREATDIDPSDISSWDTLGYSLLKFGELKKSTDAFDKALQLDTRNLNVNLHMLELFLAQRNRSSAAELEDKLKDRMGEMDAEQLTQYQKLRSRLDELEVVSK
jgi:Tfp pilus assembly protein PilF